MTDMRNALYKDIKTLIASQYTPANGPVIKQESTILEVLATGEYSKAGIVAKSGMTKYTVEKTIARLLADDRVKQYEYIDPQSKATRWKYALAKGMCNDHSIQRS